MNQTNNSTAPEDESFFSVPTPIAADFVQIGILSVLVLCGVPINLHSLLTTKRKVSQYFDSLARRIRYGNVSKTNLNALDIDGILERKSSAANRRVSSAENACQKIFLLLKCHLVSANLLIFFGYCLPLIGWLITYRWLAGNFMCKLCKFFQLFAQHASSNLMVAMATERALNVYRPTRVLERNSGRCPSTVSLLLTVAWAASVVFSLPQLYVWRTLQLMPGWEQCATIFQIQQYLNGHQSSNISSSEEHTFLTPAKIYNLSHLITIFWLPAFLISIAYGSVFRKLLSIRREAFHLRSFTKHHQHRSKRNRFLNVDNRDQGKIDKNPIERCTPTTENLPESATLLNENDRQSPSTENLDMTKNVIKTRADDVSNVRRNQNLKRTAYTVVPDKPNWRNQMQINRMFNKTLLVVVVFVLTWLPYNTLAFLQTFELLQKKSFENIEMIGTLMVLNAVINPFLYRVTAQE